MSFSLPLMTYSHTSVVYIRLSLPFFPLLPVALARAFSLIPIIVLVIIIVPVATGLVIIIVSVITRLVIIIVSVITRLVIIIVPVITGAVIIIVPRIIWFVIQVSWSRSLFSMPVMGSKQKERCYNGEDCDYCNTCCLVIPMIIFRTVGIRC